MKLAAKVVLVFLLAVMALTALHGYLAVRQQRVLFRTKHEDGARQFTSSIEQTLRSALREGQDDKIPELLKESLTTTHATQVRWVRFDATLSKKTEEDSGLQLQQAQRGEFVSFETHSGGTGTLHTFYALESLPQKRSGLQFSTPLAPLQEQNRDTLFNTLYLLGGMGLLSVLVVVWAGVRLIGRPLEKLIDKTRRIGEGDLTGPLALHSHDELGVLAAALNDMCDKLQVQQQSLQQESSARLETIEQLRHADRLKTVGRLAAGIAHEMGTPLNVVSGRAGLIASGKLSDDEVRRSAVTIKSEADRVTAVIRQLLDFARRSSPQRSQSDLLDIVRQTVALLESLAAKQNVRLVVAGDEQPMPACVDAGQIQQVLTNLVVNAIHSMPNGGQVTIQLGRDRAPYPEMAASDPIDVYSLTISDEGRGIAAENLPHIFEPFFTTKDVGQGTGLGLSIAHGIVQEHGGWIEVQSTPEVGTRFIVRLPLEVAVPTVVEESP